MSACPECRVIPYRCAQCHGWKCWCRSEGQVYLHWDERTQEPFTPRRLGRPPRQPELFNVHGLWVNSRQAKKLLDEDTDA